MGTFYQYRQRHTLKLYILNHPGCIYPFFLPPLVADHLKKWTRGGRLDDFYSFRISYPGHLCSTLRVNDLLYPHSRHKDRYT